MAPCENISPFVARAKPRLPSPALWRLWDQGEGLLAAESWRFGGISGSFSPPEILDYCLVIPAGPAHVQPCLSLAPSLQILSPRKHPRAPRGRAGGGQSLGQVLRKPSEESLPQTSPACLSLPEWAPCTPLSRREDKVLLGPDSSGLF